MTSRLLVVLVTVPTPAIARRLARAMVRQRLAACVNIVPGIASFFTWQGKIDQAREALLILKTTAARFPALRRALQAQHPYDVPEIIALPITAGSMAYLRWVRDSVS